MNRRSALCLLSVSVIASNRSLACLWDTDTLSDEIKLQANTLDLILGQFPHHGDAYYKLRIRRLSEVKRPDLEMLNDIAVAHVRLGEFNKAEKFLAEALTINPKSYKTLSNIGVSAKKQGDFTKAADFISKALKIKPAGHMGLGDWYLKALLWRSKHEKINEQTPIAHNFLYKSYKESFNDSDYGSGETDSREKSKSRPAQMVKNDQSFADGFLVLGDYLTEKGDLSLAFLAHTRAMMLGHQNPDEIRRRRRAYLTYHQTFPGIPRSKITVRNKPWAKGIANAENMINKGANWLTLFKEKEAQLLNGKKSEKLVTYTEVLQALEKDGIKKVRSDT